MGLLGGLSACSSSSSPPSVAPAAPSGTAAPTPSPGGTAAQTPRPTASSSTPSATPGVQRKTPTPDPSVAGPLNSGTVPSAILTFKPNGQAQAAEGEFNPNGTFVHQVNASDASLAALPGCGTGDVSVPKAGHALAAAYVDPSTGEVGNVIQLRFATARQAAAWWSVFTTQVKRCPKVGMDPSVTPHSVQDRRESVGIVWSEAGVLHGDTVTLAALQGRHETSQILAALR